MIHYNGYILKPNPKSPTLFTVSTEGRGGKIPKVLEGSFTSFAQVRRIIDEYLKQEPTRRSNKNVSETPTKGSD